MQDPLLFSVTGFGPTYTHTHPEDFQWLLCDFVLSQMKLNTCERIEMKSSPVNPEQRCYLNHSARASTDSQFSILRVKDGLWQVSEIQESNLTIWLLLSPTSLDASQVDVAFLPAQIFSRLVVALQFTRHPLYKRTCVKCDILQSLTQSNMELIYKFAVIAQFVGDTRLCGLIL